MLCLACACAAAQDVQQGNAWGRKVIQGAKPEYPKSLREIHIGGLVRLSVTVLPNGNVAKVNILGGNPVLGESSIKAVEKWKFVPAAAQTNEEIEFRFNPH